MWKWILGSAVVGGALVWWWRSQAQEVAQPYTSGGLIGTTADWANQLAAKTSAEQQRWAETEAHGGNPMFQTWDGTKLVPYNMVIA